MKIVPTSMAGVFIIEPTIFHDARGSLHESFNARRFHELTGTEVQFRQENRSCSKYNVLRGLHYQLHRPQGKLVQALTGAIFDVAVDLRRHSSTFGQWLAVELSGRNMRQLWLPEGFAHGFLVTSKEAEVVYKMTDYWAADDECVIAWNDPGLAIDWPLTGQQPLLSSKDARGMLFADAPFFE